MRAIDMYLKLPSTLRKKISRVLSVTHPKLDRRIKNRFNSLNSRKKYGNAFYGYRKKKLKKKVMRMYNNRCALCKNKFKKHDVVTLDHIKPVSAGGCTRKENIRPLHNECRIYLNNLQFETEKRIKIKMSEDV